MISDMKDLKKEIFHGMLNLAGRVFMHVGYSENVIIGKRGFLPEEKEKGIILVVNNRMKFECNDSAITVKLVFGTTAEECLIPFEEVLSIFSPELNAQFSIAPKAAGGQQADSDSDKTAGPDTSEKVIKVDFNKKRSQKKN